MFASNSVRATLRAFLAAACMSAAGLGVALGLSAPAQAQLAPATPAAPAPTFTPSHLAAAKDVVISSGFSRTFADFSAKVGAQIIALVTRTRPELKAPLEETIKQVGPEFDKRTDEMVDVVARMFAGAMTEPDLLATAAFYKSEAGKKYLAAQPVVIDQMVLAFDQWNRRVSTEMFEKVREEMKKKGHQM